MSTQSELLDKVKQRSFNHKETFRVLKMNYMMRMACWGARDFGVLKMDEFGETTAFWFRVSGRLHSGWVVITLDWNDTYTVRLVNNRWREVGISENVYVDELVETIDVMVERVKEYVR